MIDMHCHLDLYKDPISLLPDVKQRCEYVLAVTTSPRAWKKTKEVFSHVDCIQVALGLHPEILSSKANEIDMLLSNIQYCKFLGEVGIDGSAQHKASFSMQKDLLRQVFVTSEKWGGRIMSIHSRNAAKDVLDIVESEKASSVPILHWFSGTIGDLNRANDLGCWFSVSPAMLSGKKGKLLVSKMPLTRILPETDAPFTTKRGVPYMPWETFEIVDTLKDIFELNVTTIKAELCSNFNRLMG